MYNILNCSFTCSIWILYFVICPGQLKAIYMSTEKPFKTNQTTNSNYGNNSENTWALSKLGNNDSTENVTDLDLLKTLLDLQEQACGHLTICTLNTGATTAAQTDKDPSECCHTCSCEEECQFNGNCCPDYNLLKVMGNVTFGNVPEFLLAARQVEWSYVSRSELFTSLSVQNKLVNSSERETQEATCARLVVGHPERLPNLPPPGLDYRAISSCPRNYSDHLVSARCEDPGTGLYDNIPVYSTHTEKTYRNMHCLTCNAVDQASGIFWQPVVHCRQTVFFWRYFYNLDDVLNMLLGQRCVLMFTPDDPSINAETCTLITPASCSEDDDTQLHEVCERFYLPVGTHAWEHATFRNIACYLCNDEKPFEESCLSIRPDLPRFDMAVDVPVRVVHESRSPETLDIVYDHHGHCRRGYYYDTVKAVCRQVFCPRGFYISNGRCSPLYDKLDGLTYLTMIRVPISASTKRDYSSQVQVHLIEGAVSNFLTNALKFGEYNFGIFEKEGNYFQIHLDFSFENKVGSYAKAVSFIRELVDSYPLHPILGNMEIESAIRRNTWPNVSVIDLTTSSRLITRKPVAVPTSPTIDISKPSFCDRIRLRRKEVEVEFEVVIHKPTGRRIVGENVDFDNLENKWVQVCIENVYPQKVQDKSTPKRDNGVRETNIQEIEESRQVLKTTENGLIAMGAVAVLIVIIVSVRRVLTHLTPMSPTNTRANQGVQDETPL